MPAPLPKIVPQLCSSAPEPPSGQGWIHEIKHDGHRIIATVEHGRARLLSRPGNDATRRFAPVSQWLGKVPVRTAIIDGEVAVPDERGVTHIDHLSTALHSPEHLAFYAFDLLWLDGEDFRRRPLIERKAKLARLLARAPERIVYSDHWTGDGRALFRKVGEVGSEGIVSKRADAPYTSGPSSTWVKVKHATVGTFPVVGYVPDGRQIESLLVAEASPRGLRPVGRVEFWWPGVLDDDARQALAFLTRAEPCIRMRASRSVRWIEPRLIATVRHFGRSGGGALRAGVLHALAVAD
jgi:bifunctional non-homologous end joining protein LigD